MAMSLPLSSDHTDAQSLIGAYSLACYAWLPLQVVDFEREGEGEGTETEWSFLIQNYTWTGE
jgi:hypothetical protein